MYYFMPILKGYRRMQLKVRRMRKRGEKKKDPEKFTREKQTMLDAQHATAAPMIKRLLEEMGGLYNKAAQDLVTRGMVVPPQWVEELKDCFEDMPKRGWPEMKKAIDKGLAEEPQAPRAGTSNAIDTHFLNVNPEPLAAASIGQVHTGVLRGGNEQVIVKVLYPEIRHYMAADLANLKQAVTLVSNLLSMAMKDTIEAISLELYSNFPRELDFRVESRFMEIARRNLARHSPRIMLPPIYASLSSTSILTQGRVEGDTIATLCKRARARAAAAVNAMAGVGTPEFRKERMEAAGKQELDAALAVPRAAFAEVLQCLGKQIFVDGFFHADPHPGNIMVSAADGRPVLIDWGQCMELDDAQRRTLCEMTLLLRTRCMPLIGQALGQFGSSEFGFSSTDMGEMAALIYFFFDSQQEGPFAEDIRRMRDLVRYKPTKAGYITALPREVSLSGSGKAKGVKEWSG